MDTIDRMSFDGRCDPNPGGALGWAAIITFADGHTAQAHGEAPPNPANTVNVAEYRGLLDGLRAYLDAGAGGPLAITGDSQLIINQVNGVYQVRSTSLQPYHQEVQALLAQIRDVSVTWKPREHNTAADRLARTAPAPTTRDATADLVLTDAMQAQLPAAVRAAVAQLHAHVAPGFNDFASLRSGGVDACSKLGLEALQQRAGAAATTRITDALSDPKAQAAALRWALRGLAVARAIRNVQVDVKLAANAQRAQRR